MSDETDKVKNWWFFFPMTGLDLIEDTLDLENPIFEDATIISAKHYEQIVSIGRISREPDKGYDDMLASLLMPTVERRSFIAVRWSNKISDKAMPWVVKETKKRAYRIAGLLALTCLAYSPEGKTCALTEQLHLPLRTVLALDLQEAEFHFETNRATSRTFWGPATCEWSRADLLKTLNAERFAPLTKVLTTSNQSLHETLHIAITAAALRLFDAVHALAPSAQLLGAVTSIEILIGTRSGPWDKIKGRIEALLGGEALTLYSIEAVMNARHEYVHGGKEVAEADTATSAIGLALSCLLHYAEGANGFGNRTELIDYLDKLYETEKLDAYWNGTHGLSRILALQHIRRSYQFPFMPRSS